MSVLELTPTQAEAQERRKETNRLISERAVVDRPIKLAKSPKGRRGTDTNLRMVFMTPDQFAEFHRQREFEKQVKSAIAQLKSSREERAFQKRALSKPFQILDVMHAFCRLWETMTFVELTGDRRTKTTTVPRHLCMMLCRALTKGSMPEIGRLFGNRDHTTVLHGCRRMELVKDEMTRRMKQRDEASLDDWITEAISILRGGQVHVTSRLEYSKGGTT